MICAGKPLTTSQHTMKTSTHHESGEVVLVLLSLRTQVLQVEVAIGMGLNGNDLEACHNCRLYMS